MDNDDKLVDFLVEEVGRDFVSVPFYAWLYICKKTREQIADNYSHIKLTAMTEEDARLWYTRYCFQCDDSYINFLKSVVTGYPDSDWPSEVKKLIKLRQLEMEILKLKQQRSSAFCPESKRKRIKEQRVFNKGKTKRNLEESSSSAHVTGSSDDDDDVVNNETNTKKGHLEYLVWSQKKLQPVISLESRDGFINPEGSDAQNTFSSCPLQTLTTNNNHSSLEDISSEENNDGSVEYLSETVQLQDRNSSEMNIEKMRERNEKNWNGIIAENFRSVMDRNVREINGAAAKKIRDAKTTRKRDAQMVKKIDSETAREADSRKTTNNTNAKRKRKVRFSFKVGNPAENPKPPVPPKRILNSSSSSDQTQNIQSPNKILKENSPTPTASEEPVNVRKEEKLAVPKLPSCYYDLLNEEIEEQELVDEHESPRKKTLVQARQNSADLLNSEVSDSTSVVSVSKNQEPAAVIITSNNENQDFIDLEPDESLDFHNKNKHVDDIGIPSTFEKSNAGNFGECLNSTDNSNNFKNRSRANPRDVIARILGTFINSSSKQADRGPLRRLSANATGNLPNLNSVTNKPTTFEVEDTPLIECGPATRHCDNKSNEYMIQNFVEVEIEDSFEVESSSSGEEFDLQDFAKSFERRKMDDDILPTTGIDSYCSDFIEPAVDNFDFRCLNSEASSSATATKTTNDDVVSNSSIGNNPLVVAHSPPEIINIVNLDECDASEMEREPSPEVQTVTIKRAKAPSSQNDDNLNKYNKVGNVSNPCWNPLYKNRHGAPRPPDQFMRNPHPAWMRWQNDYVGPRLRAPFRPNFQQMNNPYVSYNARGSQFFRPWFSNDSQLLGSQIQGPSSYNSFSNGPPIIRISRQ